MADVIRARVIYDSWSRVKIMDRLQLHPSFAPISMGWLASFVNRGEA